MLVRYIVKADGKVIDHAERENKAWKLAHKYAYQCYNQDIPVFPNMCVEKEIIY